MCLKEMLVIHIFLGRKHVRCFLFERFALYAQALQVCPLRNVILRRVQ